MIPSNHSDLFIPVQQIFRFLIDQAIQFCGTFINFFKNFGHFSIFPADSSLLKKIDIVVCQGANFIPNLPEFTIKRQHKYSLLPCALYIRIIQIKLNRCLAYGFRSFPGAFTKRNRNIPGNRQQHHICRFLIKRKPDKIPVLHPYSAGIKFIFCRIIFHQKKCLICCCLIQINIIY